MRGGQGTLTVLGMVVGWKERSAGEGRRESFKCLCDVMVCGMRILDKGTMRWKGREYSLDDIWGYQVFMKQLMRASLRAPEDQYLLPCIISL